MFLRILILFFAINSLIPSATALTFGNAGSAPSKLMMGTMSSTDLVSDTNSIVSESTMNKSAMSKHCTMGNSCMMDMDSSCDPLHCSSGYAVNSIKYFAFVHGLDQPPHFTLAHFYHIVHPVHTPPPLV